MLKSNLVQHNQAPSLFISPSPTSLPKSLLSSPRRIHTPSRCKRNIVCCVSNDVMRVQQQEALGATTTGHVTIKAVVTVKVTMGGIFAHMGITRGLDDIGDLLGKCLLLEFVSQELDPKTGKEKETSGAYVHKVSHHTDEVKYEGEFSVPNNFGEIGAVLVENEHHKEMYIHNIVLMTGDETTALTIDCRSWVHSKFDNPEKRVFFTTKSREVEKKELEILRGDGTGERKRFERIYDYDTYNDLGDPITECKARPVLGGTKELPYPRRCRTGRPKTKNDPLSEKRKSNIYVPRDEAFSEQKQRTFSVKTLRSVFHALVPSIKTSMSSKKGLDIFSTILPRLVKSLAHGADDMLLFETPPMINRDKFSWFRDEEFSRQTLAGLNPFSIQLVTEFPFVSKLDPEIYGPPESAITEAIIERQIKGDMTLKEALERKKLFILDYHDLLLPFVHKVRELEDTTLYGSRTVFFLTVEGTLRPTAIELTRPKSPTKPQWKQVFTYCWDATGTWLWKLAKAHVCAHDAGQPLVIAVILTRL